jgi:hypothetical protein
MFLHIPFTYTRKTSRTNTLSCGTPDVILNPSDNCLPALTLCERPKRESFILTTTFEYTPDPAFFVSSRSYGTNSKAFEDSIIVTSILVSSSRESTLLWQAVTIWLSHHYPGLNPCWPSYNHLLVFQTCLRLPAMTYSICLQITEFKLPGL